MGALFRGYGRPSNPSQNVDGGIDVASPEVVAQVKCWKATLSASAIRKLHGVAKVLTRQGMFFSTTSYTSDAQELARAASVALFVMRPSERKLVPSVPSQRVSGTEGSIRGTRPACRPSRGDWTGQNWSQSRTRALLLNQRDEPQERRSTRRRLPRCAAGSRPVRGSGRGSSPTSPARSRRSAGSASARTRSRAAPPSVTRR